jgi:hypothetical protein
MTKDEALRLALDALEPIPYKDDWTVAKETNKAIIAIKEALANEALEKMAENARELGLDYEPEQEPVGEIVDAIEGAFKCSFTKMLPVGTKLYTTPPQRKPLSDEEIEYAFKTNSVMVDNGNAYMVAGLRAVNIARAIEAAHGIKGQA